MTTHDIVRMARRVHGWLETEEIHTLYELATAIPQGGIIVEIGTYRGRATVVLASGAQIRGGRVVTIDPYDSLMIDQHGYQTIVTSEDRNEAINAFEICNLSSVITPITGYSHQVVSTWTTPIALLWIDGSHHYADVTRDLADWSPYANVIAMHDTSGNWPGVSQALNEFLARGEWQLEKRVDSLSVLRKGKL